MQWNRDTYTITEPGKTGQVSLIAGVVFTLATLIGFFVNREQFFVSWLVAFTFWTTIGIGGLFFVMMHHLTNAMWSIVLRRFAEAVMTGLAPMALFAVPVLLGLERLYIWTDPTYLADHSMVQAKTGYLNVPFFIVRTIIYFAVWLFLVRKLRQVSLEQDAGWQPNARDRFVRISAPGTIVFAITVTFAAFDWVMSLHPMWYSTIYGLWFFSGAITAIMAVLAFAVLHMHSRGVLRREITVEHYHDISKLMFAFLIFWGYMHLSQYLLIWYANLPEETAFFKERWVGSWKLFSIFIAVGGFSVPFVLMMGRTLKRSAWGMGVFAFWMLLTHWIDLYWNIAPAHFPDGIHLSWMDLTALLGMGGFFVYVVWRSLVSRPILPVTDPRLKKSIHFVNPY